MVTKCIILDKHLLLIAFFLLLSFSVTCYCLFELFSLILRLYIDLLHKV